MPSEIEAKFRVESHQPVRERLQAIGATSLGRVLETNVIFDRPDGSLRHRGCGLRIRSVKVEGSDDRQATLTFKGPVRSGPFKSREELEIEIGDAETAANIFHGLGFVVVLSYQKRRESWRRRDCRIELDEPPHIGLFVEIEGPNEAAIRAVQAELGLKGTAHVKASYVHMLFAYCREHGVTSRVLELPDASTPAR